MMLLCWAVLFPAFCFFARHLPSATAEHLVTLAWCNEHDAETEQVATGQLDARNDHSRLQGVRELALRMGDWSHAASQLGDEFCKEACWVFSCSRAAQLFS